MKRLSFLAIPAALLFAGTALAWAPTGDAVCNKDGSATYTVTLHADGPDATYSVTDGPSGIELAGGSYTNGQIIHVVQPYGGTVVVQETQGKKNTSRTFGPITCPQPTPLTTPHPTPPATSAASHAAYVDETRSTVVILFLVLAVLAVAYLTVRRTAR